MTRILKFLGLYLAVSTAAAIGMLVSTFPNYPKSLTGWLLLFLLALPLGLIGESFGEIAWKNPIAKGINGRTSEQATSALRILYALLVMLLWIAFCWRFSVSFGLG